MPKKKKQTKSAGKANKKKQKPAKKKKQKGILDRLFSKKKKSKPIENMSIDELTVKLKQIEKDLRL